MPFEGYVGRSHFIRMDKGGHFPPHRDHMLPEVDTMRLFIPIKNIYFWNTSTNEIDEKALENCKHIIHLSGYPILKRWTKKNKRLIHSSLKKGA